MKDSLIALPKQKEPATMLPNDSAAASRVSTNREGIRVFNRFAVIVALILLIAASVQTFLYNRLMERLDFRMREHTAALQQTNQEFAKDLKTMGSFTTNETLWDGSSGLKNIHIDKISTDQIRILQRALIQKGYLNGKGVNGKFDQPTALAWQKFLLAHNLENDADLTKQTLQKLGVTL